jgi:hypothetical protein
MTQEISEIDHSTPRDLRFSLLDVVRKSSRSFADNLEKSFGCARIVMSDANRSSVMLDVIRSI